MNLTQLWKKFCGWPEDEPFDPRRDLLKPRLNRLETCEVKPGLYHYLREVEGVNTRFHLRVDSNASGVLLANSTSAARLRPSGAIIAKAILDGDDDATITAKLQKSFHGVSDRRATDDIERVRSILRSLEMPGDNYPILNLGDPSFGPDVVPLKKPLSADVPLAEAEKLVPILDRLWQEGIPHVTLIASTGFDGAALVRAVERAEDLGMIAGVRVRASEIDDDALVTELAQAGVDHINVLYLSSDAEVHDAIAGTGDHAAAARALERIRSNEVCPVAEVGLVEPTLDTLEETIEGLTEAGVTNVAFFALATEDDRPVGEALTAGQLIEAADMIEEFSEAMRVRYLWYPPVQAAAGIPIHEQVCQGPRTSGDHAIRVETDGAVFAARGPWQAIGDVLQDAWESIARSEVYETYWQRVHTDTHCQECPGLVICAADCPRTATGWAGPQEAQRDEM
jgi:radical SAM protein with 4Fe4S-binding SPASM domain